MASSLNVKIKVLIFLNILFGIVCIYLAFISGLKSEYNNKNIHFFFFTFI